MKLPAFPGGFAYVMATLLGPSWASPPLSRGRHAHPRASS